MYTRYCIPVSKSVLYSHRMCKADTEFIVKNKISVIAAVMFCFTWYSVQGCPMHNVLNRRSSDSVT